MLNEPISSSSHWRIPRPERTTLDAQASQQWRALLAAVARIGDQTRATLGPLLRAVFAGLVVGGVLVAPVLAILALVGLFAPQLTDAHRAAPALIFVSLLWLALAIFGAHTQVERRTQDEPRHDRS